MDMITENRYYSFTILSSIFLFIGCIRLINFLLKKQRESVRNSYPKDTVILHQFALKNKGKPQLSPFCLKIESWLKVTGTKYQNEYKLMDRSDKGKLPYITYNGVEVNDSVFIIKYLSEKFGIDLNGDLTLLQKSVSRGFFRLTEDGLRWAIVAHRYKYGTAEAMGIPNFFYKDVQKGVIKQLNLQGYGTHTQQEVYDLGKEDFKALDDYLGKNKYFFGEKLSLLDLEVFSWTAQVPFYDRGQLNTYFNEKCPNLLRHYNMMKDEIWPEWNEKFADEIIVISDYKLFKDKAAALVMKLLQFLGLIN